MVGRNPRHGAAAAEEQAAIGSMPARQLRRAAWAATFQ